MTFCFVFVFGLLLLMPLGVYVLGNRIEITSYLSRVGSFEVFDAVNELRYDIGKSRLICMLNWLRSPPRFLQEVALSVDF